MAPAAVRFHPAAAQEAESTYDWYAARNPSAAHGFLPVPADSYFVMGDDRDNSQDSRYWGFVKRDKIKGRVITVYWSWDGGRHWLRPERIGLSVM